MTARTTDRCRLWACLVAACVLVACGGGTDGTGGENAAPQTHAEPALRSATPAEEAKVDASWLTPLRAQAQDHGVVQVLVHLETVNLFDPDAAHLAAQQARARTRLAALTGELGDEIWPEAGFQDSTVIGMATMFVTARGFEMLLMSQQVQGVGTTFIDWRPSGPAGGLDAIEATLRSQPEVEVDLALNVEALDFTIDTDGRFRFLPSPEQQQQAEAVRARLLARVTPLHGSGVAGAMAVSLAQGPMIRLRVTRRGYAMLAAQDDLLSMRPAGWVDTSPLRHPPLADMETLAALQGGKVQVALVLRETPADNVHLGGPSWQHLIASRRRILQDVLAPLGRDAEVLDMSYDAWVELTLPAYRRLVESGDKRLAAVVREFPITVASGSRPGRR